MANSHDLFQAAKDGTHGDRTVRCGNRKENAGFFQTLSEKDQRRYAAIEPWRLGHGAITHVAEALGCSTRTIRRGMDELDLLPNDPAVGRVRRPGTGRKKITPGSEIEQNLKSLMKTRTAGDPDDRQIVFTDLTPTRLEQQLDAMKTPAGDDIIRPWMDDQKPRPRKIRKVMPGGQPADRDPQFRNISWLIEQYEAAGDP